MKTNMPTEAPRPLLQGRKALVAGVANHHSIAFAPKEDLQVGPLSCSAAPIGELVDIMA